MLFSQPSLSARAIWLSAALCLSACSAEPNAAVPAAPAPTYEAVTPDGKAVSLASLGGQVVLLNVWATWCAPCLEEIPYLGKLHETYAGEGFQVVGVNIDIESNRQRVSDLTASLPIRYAIWLDPDEQIRTLFSDLNVPASLLIDRNGQIRWTHTGAITPSTPGFQKTLNELLKP